MLMLLLGAARIGRPVPTLELGAKAGPAWLETMGWAMSMAPWQVWTIRHVGLSVSL